MLIYILIALAAFGMSFFLMNWIATSFSLRKLSYIELRNAQIEEDLKKERKSKGKSFIRYKLAEYGYEGDIIPLAIVVAVVYVAIAAVLSLLGLGDLTGALIALPVSVATSLGVLSSMRRKRIAKFDRQLLKVLASVASHLEAGDIPQMAFQKAARLVDNPLRSELEATLASMVGSESLSTAIRRLEEDYPSKAMTLLVAALSIDDRVGARLAPALRQAQATLERQFELGAEASAEISQAKGEFYAISGIMGALGLVFLVLGGDAAREAYFSPAGIFFIGLAFANYLIGVWRANKIFNKAKGGV